MNAEQSAENDAAEHRAYGTRNGSDGTYAIACTCGAATCDADGWREHYARVTSPESGQR